MLPWVVWSCCTGVNDLRIVLQFIIYIKRFCKLLLHPCGKGCLFRTQTIGIWCKNTNTTSSPTVQVPSAVGVKCLSIVENWNKLFTPTPGTININWYRFINLSITKTHWNAMHVRNRVRHFVAYFGLLRRRMSFVFFYPYFMANALLPNVAKNSRKEILICKTAELICFACCSMRLIVMRTRGQSIHTWQMRSKGYHPPERVYLQAAARNRTNHTN